MQNEYKFSIDQLYICKDILTEKNIKEKEGSAVAQW